MPKRIFWKQMIIQRGKLATTLTTLNLQPRQFQITDVGSGNILVLYVDKEIPNVE